MPFTLRLRNNDDLLFVYLYVDDLIFADTNSKIYEDFKKSMVTEFEITNGGLVSYLSLYYLYLSITQFPYFSSLTQQ